MFGSTSGSPCLTGLVRIQMVASVAPPAIKSGFRPPLAPMAIPAAAATLKSVLFLPTIENPRYASEPGAASASGPFGFKSDAPKIRVEFHLTLRQGRVDSIPFRILNLRYFFVPALLREPNDVITRPNPDFSSWIGEGQRVVEHIAVAVPRLWASCTARCHERIDAREPSLH